MDRTSVYDISIPIIPRGDPGFIFVRRPAGGQYVVCFSGLYEDDLAIRAGDYERVIVPMRVRGMKIRRDKEVGDAQAGVKTVRPV